MGSRRFGSDHRYSGDTFRPPPPNTGYPFATDEPLGAEPATPAAASPVSHFTSGTFASMPPHHPWNALSLSAELPCAACPNLSNLEYKLMHEWCEHSPAGEWPLSLQPSVCAKLPKLRAKKVTTPLPPKALYCLHPCSHCRANYCHFEVNHTLLGTLPHLCWYCRHVEQPDSDVVVQAGLPGGSPEDSLTQQLESLLEEAQCERCGELLEQCACGSLWHA